MKDSWGFKIGIAIVGFFLLIAIFAPWLPVPSPLEQNLELEFFGPRPGHPLGLGENGVDVLSHLVHATRVSLGVSLISVLISASVGGFLGLISALKRGWVDQLIMRLVDIVYSFPGILLVVALAAFLGPSITNLILCLSLTGWASYARIIRGVSLSLVERDFVQGARALGASNSRILLWHLFPNVLPTMIVKMTYGIGSVILAESSLGFLGLGAPPGTPSWGQLLNSGREVMTSAPHLVILPASALVLTVMAFNLIGDAVRDAIDPKMRT